MSEADIGRSTSGRASARRRCDAAGECWRRLRLCSHWPRWAWPGIRTTSAMWSVRLQRSIAANSNHFDCTAAPGRRACAGSRRSEGTGCADQTAGRDASATSGHHRLWILRSASVLPASRAANRGGHLSGARRQRSSAGDARCTRRTCDVAGGTIDRRADRRCGVGGCACSAERSDRVASRCRGRRHRRDIRAAARACRRRCRIFPMRGARFVVGARACAK